MWSGDGGSASRAARHVVAEAKGSGVGGGARSVAVGRVSDPPLKTPKGGSETRPTPDTPAAPSAVVTKVRAILCSTVSALNAPATAMSTVKLHQSRQRFASPGSCD